MSNYNERKEPTFSEPKNTSLTEKEFEVAPEKAKVAFSLHTNATQSYTIPPIKKPMNLTASAASTSETQATQQVTNTTAASKPLEPTSTKPHGGFTFAPITEENTTAQPTGNTQKSEADKSSNTMERVIPTHSAKAAVEKVPSKYRRLLIVLLLLLALLLVFFLLKPKAPESIEALQQGSSLPIEFRPVDEEEAKRAEAQQAALQQAQSTPQQAVESSENFANSTVGQENASLNHIEPAQNINIVQEQPALPATHPAEPQVLDTKPLEPKPIVQEPIKKPVTSGSVIYQPESASKPVQTVKPAQPAKSQPKVEKAEKAKLPSPPKTEATKPTSTATVVASKTLTVPKGVSLMQVFRDNQLNISDVNAMSKVNNIVSNLKVGEKVTVRLDKNNRVVEMSVGTKGKFIRQDNGSYLYK